MTGIEYDGLVVEGPNGVRLLAIPTQTLEILRFAEVIQYKCGDRVSRMRVANFMAPRSQEQATQDHEQEVREAEQEIREQAANSAAVAASWVAGSAAANGEAEPLPHPSPTPPEQGQDEQEAQETEQDPANIPLRTRRNGEWVTIYVTREQYENYQAQGRILAQAPEDHQEDTPDGQ